MAAFSPPLLERLKALKRFQMERMYRHPRVVNSMNRAQAVVTDLYEGFVADPGLLPPDWAKRRAWRVPGTVARDYIAGMTDRFALAEYARVFHTEIPASRRPMISSRRPVLISPPADPELPMANFDRNVYEPSDEVRLYDSVEEEEDIEGSRLPLLIVLALLVLAMFAGVVWLAYTQGVARGRAKPGADRREWPRTRDAAAARRRQCALSGLQDLRAAARRRTMPPTRPRLPPPVRLPPPSAKRRRRSPKRPARAAPSPHRRPAAAPRTAQKRGVADPAGSDAAGHPSHRSGHADGPATGAPRSDRPGGSCACRRRPSPPRAVALPADRRLQDSARKPTRPGAPIAASMPPC